MAKSSIYDDVRYLGEMNGCGIFEPVFADDTPRFIGFPQFIIAGPNGLRWTKTDDEWRVIMREFY